MALKRFIATNGLDANLKTIQNVSDPVNASDASTKSFSANASNLASGTVPAGVMPAHTGDVTSTAGSIDLTLATVNSAVGTYGSGSAIPIITVNAKGLITSVTTADAASSSVTVTGDVTGTGSTGTSFALTLATVNSNITAVGSTSVVPVITANAKGLVTSITSATITPAAIGAVATSALGANSGVATLDSSGKLTTSQIPGSLTGALVYQGVWNATTNSPALADGVGTTGYYYKVSVAGPTSLDSNVNWTIGDLVIFNGTTWDKVEGGTSDVVSVAGRVGVVTLSSSDISGLVASATTDTTNATNITSGTLDVARLPALTGGDVTSSIGSGTLTLATSGVTAGTYNNSATTTQSFTVDNKGRVTATGSATTITPAFNDITSKPTSLSGYGITDALNTSANTIIPLTYGDIGSNTLVTSATTANQLLDSNSATEYRTISYKVQITSATSYHSCTIDVIHDGTTAYIDQYGDMITGLSLATFDADVSGGLVRLITTPTNAITTFKLIKQMIDI